MKRRILAVLAVALLAAMIMGCGVRNSASRDIYKNRTPFASANQQKSWNSDQIGTVPVVFEYNAVGIHIGLREGRQRMQLVPDTRHPGEFTLNGQLDLGFSAGIMNRQSFPGVRELTKSYGENHYGYVVIRLRRNTSYQLVAVKENAWGYSEPYFRSFRTGRTPYQTRFTMRTAAQQQMAAANLISLVGMQDAPGIQRVNLNFILDLRGAGTAIVNGAAAVLESERRTRR